MMVLLCLNHFSSSVFFRSPDEHDSRAAAGVEVGEGNWWEEQASHRWGAWCHVPRGIQGLCPFFFIAYNSLVAIIMSKHYLKVFTVMFMFLLHRSCLHQQAMCRSVLRPVSCQPLPHLLEAWQASTCRQRTAPQNRWMTSPQETSPSSNLMTSSILTNCWWASKLCAQHV